MSKKSMKQFNERKTAQKPMQNTQPKKVKKREVEAWILAIFMIAWTVCSVLGTIGFCRTQASAESVPYDAIVQDDSDEIAVEYSTAKAINHPKVMADAIDGVDYFKFSLDAFNTLLFTDGYDISVFAGIFSIDLASTAYSLIFTSNEDEVSFDLLDESTNPIYYQYVNDLGAYNNGYVTVYCLSSPYGTPFAETISSIPPRDYYPHSYKLNFVYYDDMNGGYVFEIALRYAHRTLQNVFLSNYIIIDTSFVEPFDYYTLAYNDFLPTDYYPILGLSYSSIDTNYYQEYFNQGFTEGVRDGREQGYIEGRDIGYDEGYSNGRQQGYNEGRDIGYDEGYSNGRQQGYNEGRADGFTQGVADANEYTFAGLIGAVFDAPIQAFQGLFSFEVLGVDLSGFLLSLLTCGIALCVIKLII